MLYSFCRVLLRVCFRAVFRLRVVGVENVPAHGAVMLCANHISNFDPPIVGVPLQRQVHFMAKAELFKIPGLNWLITHFGAFPVKRGGVSKEAIRTAVRLLQEGKVLGIFPEGTRSSKGEAKKGAASIALRGKATVIPVAIIGNYALFRPMTIVYGKPVDLSEFAGDTSGDNLEKATDKIMAAIRNLMNEPHTAVHK